MTIISPMSNEKTAHPLSLSARKVQEALKILGVTCEVCEMGKTTRTAQDAARSVGCDVGQIAKSLVFKGGTTRQAVLVITSGSNRVDEKKLSERIGEPVLKADADFVRQQTGFAIGGVPPVGHAQPIAVFIDEDLLTHSEIWAAAGTPQAVFRLTPQELQKITGGRVIRVK
jgi:prolyl-tRNA editing enzyme YbaK/EbsC (Cys-tRNA(Pro) deacylase)